jgi:hypothetical protein
MRTNLWHPCRCRAFDPHAALICGEAPHRSSCESGLVSRVCIHRLPVKEIGLEQTGTPSIVRYLFSTRSSSASCRAAGASKNHHPRPAVTISLCVCPCEARLRSVTPHVFALEIILLPFARRPLRCDGGASGPKARSRRRPTERAGRHLEPRTAFTTSATAYNARSRPLSGPSSRP